LPTSLLLQFPHENFDRHRSVIKETHILPQNPMLSEKQRFVFGRKVSEEFPSPHPPHLSFTSMH
jgi:hypothetical protein